MPQPLDRPTPHDPAADAVHAPPGAPSALTETSVPADVTVRDDDCVLTLLETRIRTTPDAVAFDRLPTGADPAGPWETVTYRQFHEQAAAAAKGLIAAGLQPGGRVGVMSSTRYEWAVVELATWYAAGVVVPLYDTAAQPQVDEIITDASVTLALGGTREQAASLSSALTGAGFADAGARVWCLDDDPALRALTEAGAGIGDTVLAHRRRALRATDLATIVYTSGTGGRPKGAMLTHGNLVGQVANVASAFTDVVREGGSTIIFLPLAHVLARGLQLVCLANGMRVAHLADPRDVLAALASRRPTFLVVVPRVLDKIRSAIAGRLTDMRLGHVWARAERVATARGTRLETGRGATRRERAAEALVDLVLGRRLRALLGGRVDYLLSGAAALPPDLSRFFRGLGVPVIEGYGLTETTAPLTGNRPDDILAGCVGTPIPGTALRIADDGEVLARGQGVIAGYLHGAGDAQAFTDGWFRTGDSGRLDDVGRLWLTGRTRGAVTTAGGKTIHPETWQELVERADAVEHAVLVGEGRPYPCALVLVAAGTAAAPAPVGRSVLPIEDDGVREAAERAVASANEQVSRAERAKRTAVLTADLTPGGPFVTPTLKLRHAAFLEAAAAVIEDLYR